MTKYNKQNLERLSAIMKGLIIYKQEIKLLEDLICKYPDETSQIIGNTFPSCNWFSARG